MFPLQRMSTHLYVHKLLYGSVATHGHPPSLCIRVYKNQGGAVAPIARPLRLPLDVCMIQIISKTFFEDFKYLIMEKV
jgi:hypothetical protein